MGKVTVKHFLNTELKPVKGKPKNRDKASNIAYTSTSYPVYIRLIAGRQMTKFKSRILSYHRYKKPSVISDNLFIPSAQYGLGPGQPAQIYFTENEYKELKVKDAELNRLLELEKSIIQNIFKHEKLLEHTDFDIKDFKQHFDRWITPVLHNVEHACKEYLYFLFSGTAATKIVEGLEDVDFDFLGQIAYHTNSFISLFKLLESMSSDQNGCKTLFNHYLNDNVRHVFEFYNFFEQYVGDNLYISWAEWDLNGHYQKFNDFLISQDLKDETIKLYSDLTLNFLSPQYYSQEPPQ